MCVIELEPCEVWEVRSHRARKAHCCQCCERTIQAGETYTATFSIFEGEVSYERGCSQCSAAQAVFAEAHEGTISNPSYFPTLLDDCMMDGDTETEARWRPMREAITGKWGTASPPTSK